MFRNAVVDYYSHYTRSRDQVSLVYETDINLGRTVCPFTHTGWTKCWHTLFCTP